MEFGQRRQTDPNVPMETQTSSAATKGSQLRHERQAGDNHLVRYQRSDRSSLRDSEINREQRAYGNDEPTVKKGLIRTHTLTKGT